MFFGHEFDFCSLLPKVLTKFIGRALKDQLLCSLILKEKFVGKKKRRSFLLSLAGLEEMNMEVLLI